MQINKRERFDSLNKEELKRNILKKSQISEPISISNWSAAKGDSICTGSGTYSDPYVVKNLIIKGNGTGTGISIFNSKNVYFRIEDCTIFNCTYGIRLIWSCNGTLVNNNCYNNENGIYLEGWIDLVKPPMEILILCYCMNNTISNNIISYNEQYGLYLRNCDNNTITSNELNHNFNGIYLITHSDNNTIIHNDIYLNTIAGIALIHSDGNKIAKNTVNNNHYGIRLDHSDNNAVSNNFLCENVENIEEVNCENNLFQNNDCPELRVPGYIPIFFIGVIFLVSIIIAIMRREQI